MLTKQDLISIEKSVKDMLDCETKQSLIKFYRYCNRDNKTTKLHSKQSRRRVLHNRRKNRIRKIFKKLNQ
jgi:hypothetical protein